ncbi:MAG TPA: ABC transporter permease [Acidimicrobiales bacterium]|nr:ABC transporter permease [Acidimicrobiales bacterium]
MTFQLLAVPGKLPPPIPTESWWVWRWITGHRPLIWRSLVAHVELTVLAVVIGLAIALPLGLWSARHRRAYGPVLAFSGVLYTIPSLAAFALLVPYTGLSRTTALIPLVAYTLLILVRNVVTGLDSVPAEVKDAADGMGYTRVRRLWAVEVPLALPAIIAGVRIATVSTIGMLTIAAILGLDGLGQLINSGLGGTLPRTAITVGALLSVLLAVVADVTLAGLQRLATPWARAGRASS